ncbi:Cyclin-dependent kinase 14 [Camelus dromedarius]|uniref:Cyclin-dependent kinase 14 n=1 Tax=Camelus dromedarius TaxID=9838 RepID=A0A5N4DXY4_CAMDR|nr:Cyclin-dependent kinase 14 [Camelus dromedarius]
MDSVIKPLDTIPEDKKVRVQRTQSTFDPFEKPANQVKRVHSENNACINFKTSSTVKESPKVRRHSSPSSPTSPKFGKADSYEKLEKLGEGSYATVYKGKSKGDMKLWLLTFDFLILLVSFRERKTLLLVPPLELEYWTNAD